jgi:hypothetical protein
MTREMQWVDGYWTTWEEEDVVHFLIKGNFFEE